MDWHSMTTKAVLKELKSDSSTGLSDKAAKEKLNFHGKNTIASKKKN